MSPLDATPDKVLNLHGFRSLKFLSIATDVIGMDSISIGTDGRAMALGVCMPWIVQLLQTFEPRNNSLERIVLGVVFFVEDEAPFTMPDWQPFATILQSNSFPSLHEVELQSRYEPHMRLDFLTLMSLLCRDIHFSSLVQSGLMSVIDDQRFPFE